MAFLLSGSIRRVLTTLVCLAVVPALLIILYSGLELRAAAIENAKREMLFLARTMGEVQKGITHSTHQILATLGQIKEVHDLDGPGSSAIFRAVVANNPGLINILLPIIGLSEILLEDLPEGGLDRENVNEILMAARRAGDLVNQILSFSRQSEHKRIPLRVQQVLKEVGKLVRATIPTNIGIHQLLQEQCGPVLADSTNVHQIAMNLITNAYHAVEHNGGAITVGLQQTLLDAAAVAGTPLRQGPHALLTVSDTGHGIPAEVLPRIFDPYFTTKAQGKGTGLGLSVVYGIVREHGGDIRVYSEVGQGTSVKIYLPLIPRYMAAGPPSPAIPLPTGTERILLVDDEEPIVRMETQILERLGYRVTPRTSSVEALAAFQANPAGFDLVITDMAMPNMTGAQMARKLVAIRADIPVILCTGFSEQMTIANAGPADIKGFLMKPLVRGDLAAEIRRVLDGASTDTRLQGQHG